MSKRRMAEIVPERHRLDEILVKAHRPAHVSADLCNFQRVGHARAKVIVFVRDKNLRLEVQPPKRAAMYDPVPIPLKAGSQRVRRLVDRAPGQVFANREGRTNGAHP